MFDFNAHLSRLSAQGQKPYQVPCKYGRRIWIKLDRKDKVDLYKVLNDKEVITYDLHHPDKIPNKPCKCESCQDNPKKARKSSALATSEGSNNAALQGEQTMCAESDQEADDTKTEKDDAVASERHEAPKVLLVNLQSHQSLGSEARTPAGMASLCTVSSVAKTSPPPAVLEHTLEQMGRSNGGKQICSGSKRKRQRIEEDAKVGPYRDASGNEGVCGWLS